MSETRKLVLDIVEHYRSHPEILRRQGPTFLQLEPTPDIWLHFWGDAHSETPIRVAAQAHTHHRHFSSTIVLGSITNTIITMREPREKEFPGYEEYLLHGGDAMSASECIPTGRKLLIESTSSTKYKAGEMYDMVADSWHRTLFTEPSITILQLKGPVVPRYIAWSAGMKREEAKLKWVGVTQEEALPRIEGLLKLAGLL